jgi:hypothetical protein
MMGEAVKIYHIRKPRRPSLLLNRRGRPVFVGNGTYCGAPETANDIKHSWRWNPAFDSNTVFKLCDKCLELRHKKSEAA